MTARSRENATGRAGMRRPAPHAPARGGGVQPPVDAERWSEAEDGSEARLDETQLEALLTGIAGGHRVDGDEGWLAPAEDRHWNTE